MYALVTTSHFDRRVVKFKRAHPELKKHVARVLRDLESDPFQPRLQDPIKDPARLPWREAWKVDYYSASVDALKRPMTISEGPPPGYGEPGA